MSLSKENHKSDSLIKKRKGKIYQKSLKENSMLLFENPERIKEIATKSFAISYLLYIHLHCQISKNTKTKSEENLKSWEIIFHTNFKLFCAFSPIHSLVQQHKINEIFSLGQIIK